VNVIRMITVWFQSHVFFFSEGNIYEDNKTSLVEILVTSPLQKKNENIVD